MFGFLGVLIAAPLAGVLHVLVKKLSVRCTLGEDTSAVLPLTPEHLRGAPDTCPFGR